jgi:hypothetical protein
MSLLEMQEALAKILTNEPLRQSFLAASQSTPIPEEISQLGITLQEWDHLRAIDAPRLNLYAHLLQHKRTEKAHGVLAWTFFLLAPDLPKVLHLYCDEKAPATISKLEEARSFYSFLARQASTIKPPYVKDIALYELTICAFIQKKYAKERRGAKSKAALSKRVLQKPNRFTCVRSEGVELVSFDYDLEVIFPFLQRGEHPPEMTPRKNHVLFYGTSCDALPRSFKVNEETRTLLELCDGRRSVAEIMNDLAAACGIETEKARSRFEPACVEMLNQLIGLNILKVRLKLQD